MDETDIYKVLKIILDKLGSKRFNWRLEGSANLKLQGITTEVRDLDITTDDDGIKVFRDFLKEYIVKDFFSTKLEGMSIICYIKGFEVEINSYGDRKKRMLDKTKIIQWKGLDVPSLPLKYAREFYSLIGRQDKVKLIDEALR
jgi:hypothetical protein